MKKFISILSFVGCLNAGAAVPYSALSTNNFSYDHVNPGTVIITNVTGATGAGGNTNYLQYQTNFLVYSANVLTGTNNARVLMGAGTASLPSISFTGDPNTGFYNEAADFFTIAAGGGDIMHFGVGQVYMNNTTKIGFANGTWLTTDAANTFAQRDGVNSQKFNFYNTYTDVLNYERGTVRFTGGVLEFGPEANGTGLSRAIRVFSGTGSVIALAPSGSDAWYITGSGHFITATDNIYDIGASGATRPRNVYTVNLTVGPGTTITNIVSVTAALDFGSILAAASADLTITVAGAKANDTVELGSPADPDPSLVFNAFVSAANTVTVRAFNIGAIAVDQASKTYRVKVTQF